VLPCQLAPHLAQDAVQVRCLQATAYPLVTVPFSHEPSWHAAVVLAHDRNAKEQMAKSPAFDRRGLSATLTDQELACMNLQGDQPVVPLAAGGHTQIPVSWPTTQLAVAAVVDTANQIYTRARNARNTKTDGHPLQDCAALQPMPWLRSGLDAARRTPCVGVCLRASVRGGIHRLVP
jgi:hypothetical protein